MYVGRNLKDRGKARKPSPGYLPVYQVGKGATRDLHSFFRYTLLDYQDMLTGMQKFEALAHLKDEELLERSLKEPSLFEVLVHRYQQAFLRKAMKVLRNKEDAEDVVLETFTKVYRNAERFKVIPGATFRSWAYKILLNSSFTLYQKRKREWAEETSLTEDMAEIIPDQGVKKDRERRELLEYIHSVCVRLPAEFSRVLQGYFLEGKSQKELAREEGVSVAAIKTRMHRAKEAFRRVGFMPN